MRCTIAALLQMLDEPYLRNCVAIGLYNTHSRHVYIYAYVLCIYVYARARVQCFSIFAFTSSPFGVNLLTYK